MDNIFGKLIKEERGSIAIMFALMINTLVLAVALPMDIGRGYMASSAVAGATDAAAIASSVEDGDDASAEAYFTANLPNGKFGISYNYDQDVTHTVAGSQVSVLASGFDVPAYFSSGVDASDAIQVAGTTSVSMNAGEFTPTDYYIIIDSSSSMLSSSGSGNTRSEAVGVAVNNFIDIVFANQGVGEDGIANYRISLTNYSSGYEDTSILLDDKEEILEVLAPMIEPSGSTCGGCGLREAKDRLIEEANVNDGLARKSIVMFMTDGALNHVDGGGPYNIFIYPDNTNAAAQNTNYTPANIVGYDYVDPSDVDPEIEGYNIPQMKGKNARTMASLECYAIKNLNGLDAVTGDKALFTLNQAKIQGQTVLSVIEEQDVDLWSISFGPGAVSNNNTYILDYCASSEEQSLHASTGNDLDEIFSEIAEQTSRVRILE